MAIYLLAVFCISSSLAHYMGGNPYRYQSDPMASVPYNQDSVFTNPFQRMVGEEFFKQDNLEKQPYSVIQDYGSYEKRLYTSVSMACTYDEVDTAGDPLAGLEGNNPRVIMQSRRFNKTPQSIMFMKLFRYISGTNQDEEKIKMTRPVSTLHKVVREDRLGNLELQMMCFYLPSKYQPEHTHPHEEVVGRHRRHAAVSPPAPMEGSDIFLYTRPEVTVYVRKFGGFALTAESWENQREILQNDLLGKKVNDDEFFCVSYNNPLQMENRRNEIWIQSMDGEPAVLSDKLQELHEADHDESHHHKSHHHE